MTSMKAGNFKFLLMLLILMVALVTAAQELSTFLSGLPKPGAWGRYRIDTVENGVKKQRDYNISIISGETINNIPYVWLEVGKTNFAGFKHGYLKILIKQNPTSREATNPFLAAFSLAYQEPGKEPFELSGGAMSFLHNRAAKVKVTKKSEALPDGDATTLKGKKYECSVMHIVTGTETEFFGKTFKVVEDGKYWLSKETPFQIVRAEVKRAETRKGKVKEKQITILLRKSSFKGAKTRFTKPVKGKKGLWGIIFH